MPELSMTGLLSPEGAVLKEPAEVERALINLWEAFGHKPDQEPSAEATTRVCMANMVLLAYSKEWNDLSQVLADLAREYPTRTLCLLLGDPEIAGQSPGQVRATVSSVCHVPQPGRPQVCCEQIVLRTGSLDGAGLDRVFLPLLVSDVPFLAWWTVDPAVCSDLLAAMRELTDRLIFDAGLPGFARLLQPGRAIARELGWFRSYRWRELIAQLFDETDRTVLDAIDRVAVSIRGGHPDDRLDALWMVAFLGGQLGWRTERVLGGGRFEFRSPGGGVEVVVDDQGGAGDGLSSFQVEAGGSHLEFARCREGSDEFRIMIHDENACRLPRSIQLKRRGRADSLAVALTGRAVDPSYERAASLALWMAEAMGARV
jgi:hypothetical protein